MSLKQIVYGILLLDMAAFTGWVVYSYGLEGFVEVAFSSWISIQIFADLCISLGLVLYWMAGDARKHGLTFWPYAIATPLLGVIAPLAYLFRRESLLRAPDAGALEPAR